MFLSIVNVDIVPSISKTSDAGSYIAPTSRIMQEKTPQIRLNNEVF